jgi:cell division protein FtsZ
VNITGGADLTLGEVHQINEIIHDAVGDDAEIIFGAVHEPAMQGEIRVTVIATGFDRALSGSHHDSVIAQKGSPVIPFPAQRPAARVTGPNRPVSTGDIPRRASSPPVERTASDRPREDLSDMEIPTFIRRQMD